MVYILSESGNPLMPTERHGHVRRLLKEGKAKVIKRTPFTIQLLYSTTEIVQSIDLGIDAGSETIGVAAANEKKVYYLANVKLRNDIVKLLADRRELRRTRRNHLRYRKPRFDNRVRSKHKGWLAPSIENKINTHISEIIFVTSILPISSITIETASFDIQKIKNADISGKEYQEGDQKDFWNVREFVLFRDGHQCQCCKGKNHDKWLNVHHIESRKTGGNAPNNLVTLCETCHKGYHSGILKLPANIKRGMKFNHATFMGIMRWTLLERVKVLYEDLGIPVENTFGYLTKSTRIENNLPKEHYIDALCISGHPTVKLPEIYFLKQKVRCHNRQIHKCNILKGGKKKLNQSAYVTQGYRLYDKVKHNNTEGFVFGRRNSGYFDIRDLDGNKINKGSVNVKKIKLLEIRKTILTERRAIPPTTKVVGLVA